MSGLRPRDEWRLKTENGTLTLDLQNQAGDPEPRWQALGKMNLTKGALLKVVVTKDRPEGRRAHHPRTASPRRRQRAKPPAPVPALLLLSSRD